MATCFAGNGQDNGSIPKQAEDSQLIAVVNRANWCTVCKENGQRFGELLMPYAARGVIIYINDLTNDTTKAVSKAALQKANIYEAVTTQPRKGMGKMLKSCGLVKDKKQSIEASGIVIFISPKTHKQLKRLVLPALTKK